jgi:hypothetical protein
METEWVVFSIMPLIIVGAIIGLFYKRRNRSTAQTHYAVGEAIEAVGELLH